MRSDEPAGAEDGLDHGKLPDHRELHQDPAIGEHAVGVPGRRERLQLARVPYIAHTGHGGPDRYLEEDGNRFQIANSRALATMAASDCGAELGQRRVGRQLVLHVRERLEWRHRRRDTGGAAGVAPIWTRPRPAPG